LSLKFGGLDFERGKFQTATTFFFSDRIRLRQRDKSGFVLHAGSCDLLARFVLLDAIVFIITIAAALSLLTAINSAELKFHHVTHSRPSGVVQLRRNYQRVFFSDSQSNAVSSRDCC
jgi:hypothetical protein